MPSLLQIDQIKSVQLFPLYLAVYASSPVNCFEHFLHIPPREYEHSAEWNFNPMGVGRNRKDSFGILELPMTATERELRVQYKRLARIYHPDKYKLASNEVSSRMTVLEGQQHFQMISNAYDHLQGT